MNNDGVNVGWRRFPVAVTSAVGAVGAVGATVPFVGSWSPSAKAKAAGAPVQVNMGKIDPGQQIIAGWRGKPVFTVHRTREMLDTLPSPEGQPAGPDSKVSEQSEHVDPKLRSIEPELAMIVNIYTHLDCSSTFCPEVAPADLGPDWKGSYLCPCHGSHYDLTGCVYKGQPAPLNLSILPYTFDADDVITIGVDREKA